MISKLYLFNRVLKNQAELVHEKLDADPLLTLVNNPKQPLHARNSLKNKIF